MRVAGVSVAPPSLDGGARAVRAMRSGSVRSLDLRCEPVEVCDRRIVRQHLDVTEQLCISLSLSGGYDGSDRQFGPRKIAVTPEDRSMLCPVEIELEEDAVRALEFGAATRREQWTQHSVIGPVTHPNGMPETLEEVAIE